MASRRAAEELISAGRVRVNGEVATDLGRRVRIGHDRVAVDGAKVVLAADDVTLVHHKPAGALVSRSDPHHSGKTVYDLLPEHWAPLSRRLIYAGRLDRESEGLLILSTDGELVNCLTHPRLHVEKEYLVTLDGVLSPVDADRLSRGVELEDGPTLPCQIERLRNSRVRVILTEGRNRQIRRMMALVGRRVVRLVRLRMGGVVLGDLGAGDFRLASRDEISAMKVLSNENNFGQESGGDGADVH